jgi:hypothetical protein
MLVTWNRSGPALHLVRYCAGVGKFSTGGKLFKNAAIASCADVSTHVNKKQTTQMGGKQDYATGWFAP